MPVTCQQSAPLLQNGFECQHKDTLPTCLRIGPAKYAYIYSLIEVRGDMWYKCDRGSDDAPAGYKLWMHFVNGGWEAFDAPNDDPTWGGVAHFRSNDFVLVAGWHTWDLIQWPGRSGDFQTTTLN